MFYIRYFRSQRTYSYLFPLFPSSFLKYRSAVRRLVASDRYLFDIFMAQERILFFHRRCLVGSVTDASSAPVIRDAQCWRLLK